MHSDRLAAGRCLVLVTEFLPGSLAADLIWPAPDACGQRGWSSPGHQGQLCPARTGTSWSMSGIHASLLRVLWSLLVVSVGVRPCSWPHACCMRGSIVSASKFDALIAMLRHAGATRPYSQSLLRALGTICRRHFVEFTPLTLSNVNWKQFSLPTRLPPRCVSRTYVAVILTFDLIWFLFYFILSETSPCRTLEQLQTGARSTLSAL